MRRFVYFSSCPLALTPFDKNHKMPHSAAFVNLTAVFHDALSTYAGFLCGDGRYFCRHHLFSCPGSAEHKIVKRGVDWGNLACEFSRCFVVRSVLMGLNSYVAWLFHRFGCRGYFILTI
jgi:hypothetical protein